VGECIISTMVPVIANEWALGPSRPFSKDNGRLAGPITSGGAKTRRWEAKNELALARRRITASVISGGRDKIWREHVRLSPNIRLQIYNNLKNKNSKSLGTTLISQNNSQNGNSRKSRQNIYLFTSSNWIFTFRWYYCFPSPVLNYRIGLITSYRTSIEKYTQALHDD
jgi:hypothetical protein